MSRAPVRGSLLLAVLLATASLHTSAQAFGHGRNGKRTLLPRDVEIALARSAAPKEVSAAAEILVLTDTGYAVAVRGTNGNSCLVDRSWPESLEPICYDAEAAASIMPTHLRRAALLQAGATMDAINREIADGLLSGRFRTPTRPAMSYMMSAAQVLFNDAGKRVGAWEPHLMIFYPNLTSTQLGLGATPNPHAAIVVDEASPWSNIMVIVKQAIAPDGGSGVR